VISFCPNRSVIQSFSNQIRSYHNYKMHLYVVKEISELKTSVAILGIKLIKLII